MKQETQQEQKQTQWFNRYQAIKSIIESNTTTQTKLNKIHSILDEARAFKYNFISEDELNCIRSRVQYEL